MTLRRSCLAVAALMWAAAAVAQEDEAPDLAFLEYLGSWQESDEEWLVVAEELATPADDEEEDTPEAETDDTEQDDED